MEKGTTPSSEASEIGNIHEAPTQDTPRRTHQRESMESYGRSPANLTRMNAMTPITAAILGNIIKKNEDKHPTQEDLPGKNEGKWIQPMFLASNYLREFPYKIRNPWKYNESIDIQHHRV